MAIAQTLCLGLTLFCKKSKQNSSCRERIYCSAESRYSNLPSILVAAIIVLFALGQPVQMQAQVYLLNGSNTNQTFNTCSGTFYDSGGASANYGNNENFTITFCSSSSDPITIQFDYLNIENGWDYLYVYNGPGTGSPQFGGSPFTGNSAPSFTSAPGGCITFQFTSDGSVTFPGWAASITCGAGSTNYNNPGGTISTCSGVFYDTGGPGGNYGNNQNITTTFCSNESEQCVNVNFTSFSLENSWDFLYVYDGPSIASPLIGSYTGANSPGNVTGSGGCLTFRFTSDGSVTFPGWAAIISCTDCDAEPPGDGNPPGCPSIDVGPGQELNCATACTQLQADVTETGLTTSYEVGSIPYNPPYPFTGGTPLFIGQDDIYSGLINLPFNFCFYGTMYSQAVVGANGLVSFNAGYANAFCPWAFNQAVPNAALPLNAIFGAYHDIDPSQGGEINYAILGEAPCRTFVVNFNEIPHFSCNCGFFSTCRITTQQIVIYETTNIIDVYIDQKETCTGWNNGNAVIGIQNATGTAGITPPGRNTGPWSASNEAWRFTPNGPPNYVINWYDEQNTLIGSGASIEVCPQQSTTYTGEVIYQHCDGSTVIETDEVTVEIADSFTLNEVFTDESCPGACDGSIEITTNDGLPPFVFDIGNGPEPNGSFGDLCAGDYTITVTDANECVSVAQITIDSPPIPDPGEDNSVEVCENDPSFSLLDQLLGTPEIGGQWTNPQGDNHSGTLIPGTDLSGNYTYTVGFPGCEFSSVVSVHINPVYETLIEETICEGESVTLPDGLEVNTAGVYDVTLQSTITGCDSTVTTMVIVNPLLFSEQEFTICEDEFVTLPDGSEVNTAGSYDVTLQSVITGCDSMITTTVVVNPLLFSEQEFTICEEEFVTLPDGSDVNTAGVYDVTLQSVVTGCDSTITTTVIVNPLLFSEQEFTICEDEFVTLPDGSDVNTAGVYDVTLQSVVTGCDSTITTTMIVNPLLFSEQEFTICEDEFVTLPDGSEVNTAGVYDVTLQSVVTGCDSTITTTVIVNPLLFSEQEFTICEDEFVTLPDGSEVNAPGSYDVTLQSTVTGCDSTITTTVIVNPLLFSEQEFTICENEFVTLPDGSEVNTAGVYDVTLQSVITSCDSTITTTLIVNPLLFSEQEFTICEDEFVTLPDGSEVNTAGVYDVTLQSVVTGCDSTITTTVIVNPLLFSDQEFTMCEDEFVTLPDGSEVNTAGVYDVTLQSVITGCDSTITTTVIVNPLLFSEQEFTICEDEFVTLPDGSEVNTAGVYDVTLQSVITGCDSTITTTVLVNPLLLSEQEFAICQNEFVTLPDGSQVNEAGNYNVTLQSLVTGCDSTITTSVIVNPPLFSEQEFTICEDEFVTLPDGSDVNTAGSYEVTLQSAVTGCDSTITTNVNVVNLIAVSNLTEVCEPSGAFYSISFEISGGDNNSYEVTGVDGNITPGAPSVFTSNPIPEGESYNISVFDGNACNTIVLTGTVSCNCPAIANLTGGATICEGDAAELTLTFTGAAPFSVTYSDGTSNFTFNNLNSPHTLSVSPEASTTYSLVGMSDANCTGNTTGSATITVNSLPDAGTNGELTLCVNGDPENLFNQLGGNPAPGGTWTDPGGNSFTNAFNPGTHIAGEYTYTVEGATPCPSASSLVSVDLLEVVSVESIVEECSDAGADYTVSFEILGGIAASYQITGNMGTIAPGSPAVFTSDPIASGQSYSFEVFDINGCNTIEISGTVACDCPVEAAISGDSDICLGNATNLTFTLDGTGPFDVVYTDGTENFTLTGILNGHTISVAPDVTTTFTLVSVTDQFCPGTVSGSATVTVTSPPFAGNNASLELCADEVPVSLFELLGGNPTAGGSWIDPNGNDFSGTLDPDVALSGTYTYTVFGGLCPDDFAEIDVVIHTLPQASIVGDASICDGILANLGIDLEGSGTWTVIYAIDGIEQPPIETSDESFIIETGEEGTYTIISVSDEHCVGTGLGAGLVEINESPTAHISGQGAICPGDEAALNINLTGEGDWTVVYSIDGIQQDPLVISDETFELNSGQLGVYELISVVDANCPGTPSGSAEIEWLDYPEATLSGGGIICPSETTEVEIELSGQGDITVTYLQNGELQSLTSTAGTVVFNISESADFELVSVSDAFCSGIVDGSASVQVMDLPIANISGGGTICAGESTEIEFEFEGSAPFVLTYTLNGVEQELVSNDNSASVSVSADAVFELVGVSDATCNNAASGTAVVSVNELPTGVMSGGGILCAGEEAEIQIDFTGSGNWTFVITHNGETEAPINTNVTPYTINTGLDGLYELIIVEDDNCVGTVEGSADIDVNDLPTATLSGEGAICSGQPASLQMDLTGVGPWTVGYAINGVQQPPLVVNASPYELITSAVGDFTLLSVADQHCIGTVSGTGTVSEYPLPTANISGNALICPTESAAFNIVLSGTAPWTVIYSINGVQQDPLVIDASPFVLEASNVGSYTINSVADAHCSNFGTGTAVLAYAPYPTATLTGGGTFCPGEMGNVAILFTGIGPWTFEYAIDGEVFGPITTSSSSYTLFDDITGTYTLVSVSDANCGGTFEGEAVVNFNLGVLAEISPGGGVCPGESLTLHANGIGGVPPYSYQWFNADNDAWVQFDDSITVAPFTNMNIYVVVTDQCGSTAHSDTVLAYPHQIPLASFDFTPRHDLTVQNTTLYYNSETSLFAHAIYWEFYELTDNGWHLIGTSYEQNPVFTYPDDAPGEYQACLYVTTINGCTHQMCLPLEILDTFIFYMPNAFTPNEDGINDLYGPVMEGVDPDAYEFFIVNRWGETVFYTNDIDQKWNGSGMNGTHYAPDGVYSWKVKVRQLGGTDAKEYSGHVTLVR